MTRTLLVIDIQNEYFPGGHLPLWKADETEERIVDAMKLARECGDQIVLVRHVSNEPSGPFAENSEGTVIRAPILAAAGDAPIVTKNVADSFQDTDLLGYLAGTEELLICGMMTQNCVAFTALSRSADPFYVSVIGELCTAPSEAVHKIALNALASKFNLFDSSAAWGVEISTS